MVPRSLWQARTVAFYLQTHSISPKLTPCIVDSMQRKQVKMVSLPQWMVWLPMVTDVEHIQLAVICITFVREGKWFVLWQTLSVVGSNVVSFLDVVTIKSNNSIFFQIFVSLVVKSLVRQRCTIFMNSKE